MPQRPKSILILSTKSAGSSALQTLLCRFGGARHAPHTRHGENETLYWTKAASVLRKPQVKLPDSEVPIRADRALRELREFLAQNVPGITLPAASGELVFEGWRALCERYAPAFVEKSPHHLHQWSALELIAEAAERLGEVDFRFVGLVRNPMDVLYSAWDRWRTRPEVLQHHWRMAHENLLRWREVAGDRLTIVRYEDFSARSGTATRLLKFLDLPTVADGADEFIHGSSRLKWKADRWFGFELDPSVAQTARAFGYADAELHNEPRPSWRPYSLVRRAAHRSLALPTMRLRRLVRRLT